MQWNRFRRAGGESCHRYPSAAPPTYKSARQLTELANFPSVVSTSPDRSMGRQFAELANVKQLASSGSSSESRFWQQFPWQEPSHQDPSWQESSWQTAACSHNSNGQNCWMAQRSWQASTWSTADTQTPSNARREAKQVRTSSTLEAECAIKQLRKAMSGVGAR